MTSVVIRVFSVLGSSVDTRSCVSLRSFLLNFRLDVLAQGVQEIWVIREMTPGTVSVWCKCLVRQWIYACVSIRRLFGLISHFFLRDWILLGDAIVKVFCSTVACRVRQSLELNVPHFYVKVDSCVGGLDFVEKSAVLGASKEANSVGERRRKL